MGCPILIKMVAGVYQPDEGEIYFDDQKVTFNKPRTARDAGIETIYQDLALAENLDVGSNVFLGREVKKNYLGGLIHTLNRRKMQDASAGILSRLEIYIPSVTEQKPSMKWASFPKR